MLQKISNKCCAFELSINQNNPGKQKSLNIKQPNSLNTDNNKKCLLSNKTVY